MKDFNPVEKERRNMFIEDQQKKRKIDYNESEALEKKQRVEQLVTALCRTDRKSSTSDNEKAKSPTKSKSRSDSGFSDNTSALNEATTKFLKNVNLEKLKDNVLQVDDSKGKPVAKVVHYTPKIISVDSLSSTSSSFTKVQKSPGHLVPPSLSSSVPPKNQKLPEGVIRVPRDSKIPLIVYNPPRFKSSAPPMPSAPVSPVYPVVTTASPSNMVVIPPQLREEDRAPPSLIPASSFQYSSQFHMATIHKSTLLGRKSPTEPTAFKKPCQPKPINNTSNVSMKCETKEKMKLSENSGKKIFKWSVEDVYNHFLKSDCSDYAEIFREQEIDGTALQHLNEMNISRLLGVKMGPAIKLSAIIKELKEGCVS